MSSLVLYVGIAVTFLTLWGVVMVGAYLLGREPTDAPAALAPGRMTERSLPGKSDLVGCQRLASPWRRSHDRFCRCPSVPTVPAVASSQD